LQSSDIRERHDIEMYADGSAVEFMIMNSIYHLHATKVGGVRPSFSQVLTFYLLAVFVSHAMFSWFEMATTHDARTVLRDTFYPATGLRWIYLLVKLRDGAEGLFDTLPPPGAERSEIEAAFIRFYRSAAYISRRFKEFRMFGGVLRENVQELYQRAADWELSPELEALCSDYNFFELSV
jgi:hypothetical protein